MTTDEKYMYRCIELAKLGASSVSPNPMVGSVIVYDDKIIGEGYHRTYGGAHAEVNAIASVKNKELLSKSTIYVNLEPCAHHGKTPPCADLLVRHKIPRVVIGSIDPFAKVAGKGIEILKKANVSVTTKVLKEECDMLNKHFFTFHVKKRPYIYLKWAQTLDGFIDVNRDNASSNRPTWISNELARSFIHKQRTEIDAVMVGTNTAEIDNPMLTVRDWHGKNPTRVIIDKSDRLSKELNIFNNQSETIVFTNALETKKTGVRYIHLDTEGELLSSLINKLYKLGIQSILIEGGATLLNNFLNEGLWDEIHLYTGNCWFENGVKAPKVKCNPSLEHYFDDTILKVFYNKITI